MTKVSSIERCRLCDSKELVTLFSLGEQALTGVFLDPVEEDPVRVPLEMVLCSSCKFLQLRNTVDPDVMYEKYYYRSGTNSTMRNHLASIASDIQERLSLSSGDAVLDTGCNDGTLLFSYTVKNLIRVGVDPNDIVKEIDNPDIVTINDYFSESVITSNCNVRRFKAITSISMFYDLDDPHSFVRDVAKLLTLDGIWVVEMNYTGNMIEKMGYDMISHEHVAYYTVETFRRLIEMHGLHLHDVSFSGINSGSVRFYVGRTPGSSNVVALAIEKERELDLGSIECYERFANEIENYRTKFIKLIDRINSSGKRIFIYGASTRGNTILQHCNLGEKEFPFAADRNPKKWGLVSAGSRVPIVSEEEARAQKPDYFLILPYSFIDEFVTRESPFLMDGGKFIIPLPCLQILSMEDGELVYENV